jgi:hypothetical protein
MNKTLRVPDYLEHMLLAIERINRHKVKFLGK